MENMKILENPKKGNKKKEKKNMKNGKLSIRSDQIRLNSHKGIQDTGEFRYLQSV